MSNFFKLVLAVSMSAWFFIACNKGSGGVKVNAPKDAARGAKPVVPAAQKTVEQELEKLPLAEREKAKENAPNVRELKPLFRDSAKLFTEIWTIVVKDKKLKEKGLRGDALLNGEKNVFKFVSDLLEKRYTVNGIPPTKEDLGKDKDCKYGHGALGISTNKNVYSVLYFKECGATANGLKIAELIKQDSGNAWKVNFAREIEGVDPKDLMGNMATANSEISLNASCVIAATSQGRLDKMVCEELAQDLTKNSYGVVKTWDFSLQTKDMDLCKEGKEGKKNFCATLDIRIIDDANKEILVEAHLVDNPDLNTLTAEFMGTQSAEVLAQKAAAKELAVAAKAKEAAAAAEKARIEKEAAAKEKEKTDKAAGQSSSGVLQVDPQNGQQEEQQQQDQQQESAPQPTPEAVT